MSRTSSGPLYLVAEACLNRPSAVSFLKCHSALVSTLVGHCCALIVLIALSEHKLSAAKGGIYLWCYQCFQLLPGCQSILQLTHCFYTAGSRALHIVVQRKCQLEILSNI